MNIKRNLVYSKFEISHLVTRLDSIGGAQIHVLELARNWIEKGVSVEIWGGQTPAEQFLGKSFLVRRIPSLVRDISIFQDGRALIEIADMISRNRPTVLMLHSSKAGVLGRLSAILTDTPCVFTAHGWSFSEGMPQPFRSLCWFFEFVIGIFGCHTITVSEYDRRLGLSLGVGRADRTYTVHNGVEDIPVELRACPADSARIVMVARHCPQKDYFCLLRALSPLQDPFELLLVGDGPEIEQTRMKVEQLGLSGKVKVLGSRKDIGAILSTAGLMVLATNWEGLPRSILEGMRAGLPIVATDVGGNSELVKDGINGCLVPRGDEQALRLAISRLLGSPALRSKMGIESRRLYEEGFRSEMLFDRTLEAVKKVVSESRSFSVI